MGGGGGEVPGAEVFSDFVVALHILDAFERYVERFTATPRSEKVSHYAHRIATHPRRFDT